MNSNVLNFDIIEIEFITNLYNTDFIASRTFEKKKKEKVKKLANNKQISLTTLKHQTFFIQTCYSPRQQRLTNKFETYLKLSSVHHVD